MFWEFPGLRCVSRVGMLGGCASTSRGMVGGEGAEGYIQNMERKEVLAKIAWVGRQKILKGKGMAGWG